MEEGWQKCRHRGTWEVEHTVRSAGITIHMADERWNDRWQRVRATWNIAAPEKRHNTQKETMFVSSLDISMVLGHWNAAGSPHSRQTRGTQRLAT